MSDATMRENERALVHQEIRDLKTDNGAVLIKLDELKNQMHVDSKAVAVEIAKLQVKSTVWGGLAGVLTALVAILLQTFSKG